MFLWVGINVDKFFQKVKAVARKIDKELAYENSCFTLPMHISLKISFQIKDEEFEKVSNFIYDYFRKLQAFECRVRGIENEGNIVWIRYEENEAICKIKDDINRLLRERFSIPMHEYDYDFIFHTTLFMDDDERKNEIAFQKIKNESLPSVVKASCFCLGYSPEGKLGTFEILKEINV